MFFDAFGRPVWLLEAQEGALLMQVFKALVPPTDVPRRRLRAGQNRQADPNRRDLVPMELATTLETRGCWQGAVASPS